MSKMPCLYDADALKKNKISNIPINIIKIVYL